MPVAVVGTLSKRSDEQVQWTIDLSAVCQRIWAPGVFFSGGDVIRPQLLEDGGSRGPTGFDYQAQADGQVGQTEPKWPKVISGTIQDGSVLWTAIPCSPSALDRSVTNAGSVTVAPDDPLTADLVNLKNTGGELLLTLSIGAGTDGQAGDVVTHVVFDNGTAEDYAISVTVDDSLPSST